MRTARIRMIGSAISQLWNVMTARDLTQTGPNESISARMHRQGHKRAERVINALFWWEPEHCRSAHEADVYDARALIAEVEGRPRC